MSALSLHKFAKFHAAVFDLDGTLIHSEHAWEAAKVQVLARYGIIPTQTLLNAYVGRGLGVFLDEVFDHPLTPEMRRNISNEIGALADVLLPKMRTPVEGACELLRALHQNGLRIAICSSSPRRHINSTLVMLGITDYVEAIISGADLPRGKPDPLPYLTVLSALKLEPLKVCAFEDSVPGARSAFDAGMNVFAVGHGCTSPEYEFCHHRAESFGEIIGD